MIFFSPMPASAFRCVISIDKQQHPTIFYDEKGSSYLTIIEVNHEK